MVYNFTDSFKLKEKFLFEMTRIILFTSQTIQILTIFMA